MNIYKSEVDRYQLFTCKRPSGCRVTKCVREVSDLIKLTYIAGHNDPSLFKDIQYKN